MIMSPIFNSSIRDEVGTFSVGQRCVVLFATSLTTSVVFVVSGRSKNYYCEQNICTLNVV